MGEPVLAALIIARPTSCRVQNPVGYQRRPIGYIQAMNLYQPWRFFWPGVARMKPGRNMTPRRNRRSSSFSVAPLTRAHIVLPCSLLSVPAPVT